MEPGWIRGARVRIHTLFSVTKAVLRNLRLYVRMYVCMFVCMVRTRAHAVANWTGLRERERDRGVNNPLGTLAYHTVIPRDKYSKTKPRLNAQLGNSWTCLKVEGPRHCQTDQASMPYPKVSIEVHDEGAWSLGLSKFEVTTH